MSRLLPASLVALVALTAPALASTPSPYLPADTEVYANVNVRQFLDSPMVKKNSVDQIKQAIANSPEAQKYLSAFGLDPFADFERIVIAAPFGSDKAVVVVTGKFDAAKIEKGAAEAAKDPKVADKVKVVKDGSQTFYEITGQPGDKSSVMYGAVADGKTIVLANSKADVATAIARGAAGKAPALKKEFADLLAKAEDKTTMHMIALTRGELAKLPIPGDPNQAKALGKVDSVVMTMNVEKDFQFGLSLNAADEAAAKDVEKVVATGLEQVNGLAAIFAAQNPDLKPLVEFLKSMKAAVKGSSVTVKGEMTAESIEKAGK